MAKQPDFGAILKQAQQMQADMLKAQENLKNESVEATVGGGMVSVKMSGDLQLQEIKVAPEAVDPDDVDMLQDMVLAAVNEAIRSAQELAASKMNQVTGGLGGLGLPGM
jgi:nucleoid-associated protein EbfC